MSDEQNLILEQWKALCELVEGMDMDIRKNANGNNLAGVRARKELRKLKKASSDLVRATIEADKQRKNNK